MVADFGIARALGIVGDEPLTLSGMAVGTPEYMSPEQGSGDPGLDGRTDVYSLGCVLFEMLAGEPPFSSRTVQGTLARHRQDPVPSLRIVRPSVPVHVEAAVGQALAKVAADRFATAAEFADALEQTPAAPRRRSRSPRLPLGPREGDGRLAALGLALVIGAAMLVGHLVRGRGRRRRRTRPGSWWRTSWARPPIEPSLPRCASS